MLEQFYLTQNCDPNKFYHFQREPESSGNERLSHIAQSPREPMMKLIVLAFVFGIKQKLIAIFKYYVYRDERIVSSVHRLINNEALQINYY